MSRLLIRDIGGRGNNFSVGSAPNVSTRQSGTYMKSWGVRNTPWLHMLKCFKCWKRSLSGLNLMH